MPGYRKSHSDQVQEDSRRKALSHQAEAEATPNLGEETASPSPMAGDPAAFLASPHTDHPANTSQRARALAELQQQRGNAYVRRLLQTKLLQAKLTISSPDDQYEREADRIAEEVTRRIASGAQRQEEEAEIPHGQPLSALPAPSIGRQTEEEEEEEEELQAKRAAGSDLELRPGLESRIEAVRGSGQPMDGVTRAQMESAFGDDFRDVRVHADAEADRLNRDLDAQAFTSGQDIFFQQGAYQPGSASGRELLAHELTHVVQQNHTAHRLTGTDERATQGPPQTAAVEGATDLSSVGTAYAVQRHQPDSGCDTPEACAAMRQELLSILRTIDRQQGQTWRDAWEPIRNLIGGLEAEESISLRTMLGEIGDNPDAELTREFQERLWPAWQQQIITWLRQRTHAARQERAASAEEEPVEWETETGEEETERRPAQSERPEQPSPRVTGSVGATLLHTVESAGETFRVGDVSGSWQIIGLTRDYRGVVTVRVRNRRTREVQGWSLQDWHVQLSVAHVIRSTEAMAALAEAETRILYELALPVWIRVPAEMAWIGVVWYMYRQELESMIDRVSELNPVLDWLHQNAPASVQTFLAQRAAVRVGEAVPSAMDPVEIGREIGRTLRTGRNLIYLIISVARVARGSVTAGVSASLRAFTGVGAIVGARTLENAAHMFRDFAGLLALHNLRNIRPGAEALAREEAIGLIADWGRERGLTLDNQTIDRLITENTSEETGQRLVQVLDILRDFIELSTAVADAIDHQRPTPVSSTEVEGAQARSAGH